MMTEKTKKVLIDSIKFENQWDRSELSPGIILTHDLFGIKIEMYEYRTVSDNRRHATNLFVRFLDELPPNIINALNIEYGEDNSATPSQDVPEGT